MNYITLSINESGDFPKARTLSWFKAIALTTSWFTVVLKRYYLLDTRLIIKTDKQGQLH